MIPSRVEAYDFSHAYIGNAQCIVVPSDSDINVDNGITDLNGKSVAYQAETVSDTILTEMIANGEVSAEVFEYDKVMNCFDDLAIGRTETVLCDLAVGLFYANNPAYDMKIAWQGETDDTIGVCMKKGNTELVEAVNTALNNLLENGKLNEIATKYFGDTVLVDLAFAE
jgi:polar amino acid transport system substrate-binding protein